MNCTEPSASRLECITLGLEEHEDFVSMANSILRREEVEAYTLTPNLKKFNFIQSLIFFLMVIEFTKLLKKFLRLKSQSSYGHDFKTILQNKYF